MGEMTAVGDLPAYRAVPDGDGPWPGLVLVHEIFGLDDEMRRHADRLAAMGYVVLAPDLLTRGRRVVCLARTLASLRSGTGQAFDDLDATRAALVADPSCTGSTGVVGFCIGGGFALVLAGPARVGRRRSSTTDARRATRPPSTAPARSSRATAGATVTSWRRGDPGGRADRARCLPTTSRSTPTPGTPSSTPRTSPPGTSRR